MNTQEMTAYQMNQLTAPELREAMHQCFLIYEEGGTGAPRAKMMNAQYREVLNSRTWSENF